MNFDNHIHPCNDHSKQSMKYFYCPRKSSPAPLDAIIPEATTFDFSQDSLVLPNDLSEIIECIFFCL